MALAGLARWLRGSGTGRALAARLGAAYIRLVRRTTRWRFEGRERYDRLVVDGARVIIVMWHGRLFMAPHCADPRRRFAAMISDNRDGDLIAALFARFGIHAVRGSTYDRDKGRDKGGRRAYATALRELGRQGAVVGITPDGPRGPRMRAQPGAAVLSIATGAVVQPVAYSTSRGRLLGSWDRFLLPWPFGRGVMIWGEPLRPPAGSDPGALDGYLREIEAELTAITARADRLCGRAPVAPDPPADDGTPHAPAEAPPFGPERSPEVSASPAGQGTEPGQGARGQGATGQGAAGQAATGQAATGKDATGKDATGKDATGKGPSRAPSAGPSAGQSRAPSQSPSPA